MHEGHNRGILDTRDAIAIAEEAGLDLVEISPNNDPPICKILDLGKFKYQSQKKAAEQRKKQKTQEVKEIKMRPNIDTHDYEVKMRAVRKFLEEGDKVKLTCASAAARWRTRNSACGVLFKARDDIAELAKVEADPRMEGRQMMMVVAPK